MHSFYNNCPSGARDECWSSRCQICGYSKLSSLRDNRGGRLPRHPKMIKRRQGQILVMLLLDLWELNPLQLMICRGGKVPCLPKISEAVIAANQHSF